MYVYVCSLDLGICKSGSWIPDLYCICILCGLRLRGRGWRLLCLGRSPPVGLDNKLDDSTKYCAVDDS